MNDDKLRMALAKAIGVGDGYAAVINPTKPDDSHLRKQWADLKAQILTDIKQINDQTIPHDPEPDWWMEMMSVQALLRKRL
jgi:hypothetical protein